MIKYKFIQINPVYLLIFFFILITGVKVLFSWLFTSPQVFEDELIYDRIAQHIYNGSLLASSQPYPPHGPFPPGYSFLLSIAYFLTQDKFVAYHFMMIINAIITSTILFPAYFLLKPATSPYVALCGSLLIGLLPSVTMYTFLLLSEALFIPLFLFSVWFVYRSLSDQNPCFWDILLGFSLFLLYFTRAAGLSMIIGLVITFAWVGRNKIFRTNMDCFKKIAVIVVSGLVFPLVWIADQIITKGSLPTGYSAVSYVTQFVEILTHNPSHILYVVLLHIDYILLGTFIVFPFLALYTLYWIYLMKPWEKTNDPDKKRTDIINYERLIIPISIYTGSSVIMIFLFGISHMILPLFKYKLSGRYMDPIIPIIVLTGIIGLFIIIQREEIKHFMKRGILYILLVYALTSLIMLPFAHEPNSNPAIFYLYSLSADYLVPFFSLIVGVVLLGGVSIAIYLKKGVIPLIILIIIMTASSLVPIFFCEEQVSTKTGAILPFCEEVNALSADPTTILWDTSTDNTDWDRIVYYTLNFWIGDKITEINAQSKDREAGKKRWLITKNTDNEPIITYTKYRVVPMQNDVSIE